MEIALAQSSARVYRTSYWATWLFWTRFLFFSVWVRSFNPTNKSHVSLLMFAFTLTTGSIWCDQHAHDAHYRFLTTMCSDVRTTFSVLISAFAFKSFTPWFFICLLFWTISEKVQISSQIIWQIMHYMYSLQVELRTTTWEKSCSNYKPTVLPDSVLSQTIYA